MDPATTRPQLLQCADERDLAERAARLFCERGREAVAQRGRFAVALSGGRTPRLLYERLAVAPLREAAPWAQTRVFWGDERWLPHDHPDSNCGMARAALLDRVPLPPQNVYPMPVEGEPGQAAARYAETLREALGDPPVFDLVLLGLGADGHVASLFPGSSALLAEAPVAANWVPSLAAWRLTLTLPVINAAREVLLLVSGAGKAAVLQHALAGGDSLPVHRVRPAAGRLAILADRAAARLE